ncbi:unnamed protein product, partial [Adineta steineri]
IADDEKQRLLKGKQILLDEWQEQIDKKQKQLKDDKLTEQIADAELNKVTSTTTIIGSRLAAPYADLVENVRYKKLFI